VPVISRRRVTVSPSKAPGIWRSAVRRDGGINKKLLLPFVVQSQPTTVCRMRPEPPPPPVHGGEAEVMEVVWELGEASVRAVMDELNATAQAPRAYTTYMTSLARLHRKGLLERRRDGKTDLYRPVHTREAYADLRAQAEVAALVDTFG